MVQRPIRHIHRFHIWIAVTDRSHWHSSCNTTIFALQLPTWKSHHIQILWTTYHTYDRNVHMTSTNTTFLKIYSILLHCQITKNTLETHCHTVWPLISFFKQRVALDVLHCLTSHLSFSWLLGIYIGNAPTQQKTVIVRIFSWAGYLQQNLILIHVILRDGTDPGCTHSECTSALKCLLSPRTQTVKGLRVISHSVMILFRNDMGLERSLGDFREKNNILVLLKLWVLLLLLGKPCTCQINAKVFAY